MNNKNRQKKKHKICSNSRKTSANGKNEATNLIGCAVPQLFRELHYFLYTSVASERSPTL